MSKKKTKGRGLCPLGEKLEGQRKIHLSISRLCREAGISRYAYYSIINGKASPNIATLAKLGEFYGVEYKTWLP